MDIFNRPSLEFIGLRIRGRQVVQLYFADGSYKAVSYTVWSTHRDFVEGDLKDSGMVYLFQNGAGAGFGYWGYHVTVDTPIKVFNSDKTIKFTFTKIMEVEQYLLDNLYIEN